MIRGTFPILGTSGAYFVWICLNNKQLEIDKNAPIGYIFCDKPKEAKTICQNAKGIPKCKICDADMRRGLFEIKLKELGKKVLAVWVCPNNTQMEMDKHTLIGNIYCNKPKTP